MGRNRGLSWSVGMQDILFRADSGIKALYFSVLVPPFFRRSE